MAQSFHILMASKQKTHTHLGQHNKKGTCRAIQMPKLQYQWRNHQSPYGNLPTCTATLEKSLEMQPASNPKTGGYYRNHKKLAPIAI